MGNKNSDEKFAYLDQLSTEELEELIRADVESPEIQNDEAVFHILEVLNERSKQDPDAAVFHKDRVWRDIQTIYHVPEGEGRSLYPTDEEDEEADSPLPTEGGAAPFDPAPATAKRPRFRWAFNIAAAAVLIFSVTAIGAQAAGIDLFGFLARWTADVFRFTPAVSEYYPAVQEAFDQNHFPVELVPQWYPEDFEMQKAEVYEEDFSTLMIVPFENRTKNTFFVIQIRRYNSPQDLAILEQQWETDSQQPYPHGDKTFFVVQNEGHTSATWSDQTVLVMTIAGDLTLSDTHKIIDSIGG